MINVIIPTVIYYHHYKKYKKAAANVASAFLFCLIMYVI